MIKLAVPDIGEEELEEVKKVFDSKYLVQGDKVEEFENLIKRYLNVKHVIAVSSGTAALHLALLAMEIKSGDEVIVPDFTFPATSNVVELVGATTRLVDINLDSFCIDADQIEKEITANTKVIIPVHEFGQATDMDKILEIARRYDIKVIEDAACALGTEFKNRMVGTIGNIGCFSLHPRKAITTGEGGILATNDDVLAEKLKILRNHGLSYMNGKPQFVTAGFNYRMTNFQAAIGVVQMKKLENLNRTRAEIAKKYSELLSGIKGITIPQAKDYGKHVWQSYHIVLDEKYNRDLLIKRLKDNGIETTFGAYSVHLQPYYMKKYAYDSINYENSINAFNQGLVLPLHNQLSFEDISFIVNKIQEYINE